MAGFKFRAHVEHNRLRATIGKHNFRDSQWIVGKAADVREQLIAAYRNSTETPLDLLVATPPCQGMSSSNPSRGRRKSPMAKRQEPKNSLIFEIIPITKALRPKLIVAENVRQILTLESVYKDRVGRVIDIIGEELRDEYSIFEDIVDVAKLRSSPDSQAGRRRCRKTGPDLSGRFDRKVLGSFAKTVAL